MCRLSARPSCGREDSATTLWVPKHYLNNGEHEYCFFYYPKSLAFFCEACSYDMFLVGHSDMHTSCSFIRMSGQNWCFKGFYVTQELKEALSRQQHIETLLPWSCSVTDPKRGVVSFDSSHSLTGGIGTSENVQIKSLYLTGISLSRWLCLIVSAMRYSD